ncbi:MAG: amino acid ABC transporter permease, partial [Psychromonas sp.]
MLTKPNHLYWNGLYVAIIAALCCLVYLSAKRIDYNWNWQRVVPYIINHEASSVAAPEDGNVAAHADGSLYLESISGEIIFELRDYETLSVFEGDMIFEGDQLAAVDGWRIGPLLKG